jgi:prepilin-type N-terminal cleavage/methylation domain-containing protein/prepilin-type processing-associated H-X9-DG protein
MRRQAARAFTLVELLVVIGIIAVLIALLMPALSAARSQAMTVRCAGNLADVGRAMHQYANDFKGKVPRGYYYSPYYQQGYILWAEALSRYVGRPVDEANMTAARDPIMAQQFRHIDVYQCPVFPNDEQAVDYVINSWIAGGGDDGALINITKLKRSSEIVYLTEANVNREVERFGFHDVWAPAHLPCDVNGKVQPEARVLNDERHRGQAQILYTDWHVAPKYWKEVKKEDFYAGN